MRVYATRKSSGRICSMVEPAARVPGLLAGYADHGALVEAVSSAAVMLATLARSDDVFHHPGTETQKSSGSRLSVSRTQDCLELLIYLAQPGLKLLHLGGDSIPALIVLDHGQVDHHVLE